MSAQISLANILLKDAGVLTIASGAITVTQMYHNIAAESGSADDLDTINISSAIAQTNDGINYRLILVLFADAGDTITLKDGTGNLAIGADIDITQDTGVTLVYDGTNWRLASGGGGGGGGGGGITATAVYRYTTAQNVAKALTTLSGWQQDLLSEEFSDPDNIATLSSNQITPIAGTYYVVGEVCTGSQTGRKCWYRFYNATATTEITRTVNTNAQFANTVVFTSPLFTANGTDAYELQYLYSAGVDWTSTVLNQSGEDEVWTKITLYKVG